jgi:F0F1-type ATP synthase assembly protein I
VNDSTGLCTTLESTGVGIGVFLQSLAQALPLLLIILAIVGGVAVLIGAVAYAIKGSMTKIHFK